MKTKNKAKSFLLIILIISSLISILPAESKPNDINWWDESFTYREKIDIPFITSGKNAKFQPIDMKIKFENPCWGKDTNLHSVRVCFFNGKWQEIESQIYNIKNDNSNYISECGLVFLIPKNCNGEEQYYIYYDDGKKPSPDYIDHITIEESYYHFEPISGYPLESNYYKITDDGYINYAISKKGQIMGYDFSQHILKMKEKTKEVIPKNQDLFAAFDFRYVYDRGVFSYSSTSQKLVSTDILIDGNLMTEIKMISKSKFDDLKTTAFYKYYHCPDTDRRIHVHVIHEALKKIEVYPTEPGTNTDGIFASMQMGGIKSSSIEDLNIGKILPYMHINDEKIGISKYNLDPDPEYIPDEPDIRVLKYQDDVDLGTQPWLTFDTGENGVFHSLIFSTNKILKNGEGEKDGIQVNSFQMDFPHFPGLENNLATVQMGRNSYEPGEPHDLEIPEGYLVEFDAEFFSSKNVDTKYIENEAKIFQEIVKNKDYSFNEDSNIDNKIETYPLKIFVHLAASFPMGSTLSGLSGLNFSYISAQLYKDDELISSKTLNRLPMKPIGDTTNMDFLEKTIAVLKSFDLKNFSLFKKVIFENVEPGRYVVRIFKEHFLFNKNPQYIGFKIIDIDGEIEGSVICSREGKMIIDLSDQNNIKVSNAEIFLEKDGAIIYNTKTDENGLAIIKAPIIPEEYNLKVIYNGLNFYEKPVELNFFEKTNEVKINRYSLDLKISDNWNLPISIDINPVLKNKNFEKKLLVNPENIVKNNYFFTNLKQGTYEIYMKYKSFVYNQEFSILDNEQLSLKFPAEYEIKIKILDSRGNVFETNKLRLNRENKKFEIKGKLSEIKLSVPPGEYGIEIHNEGNLIAKRDIDIYNKKTITIITTNEPIYPSIVFFFSGIIIFLGIFLSYKKKNKLYFLTILPVAFLFSSLFLSWWEINGLTKTVETSTNMYIFPPDLITFTKTPLLIYGEKAYLPELFVNAIYLIIFATMMGSILLLFTNIIKKHRKKKLLLFTKILSIILFTGSIIIFIISMTSLSEIGVGGLIGQGTLDINTGESGYYSVYSNWGPGLGFYLYIFSIILIIFTILLKKTNYEIKSKKIFYKD